MISEKNKPLNSKRNDSDFTIEEYCKILQITKKEYKFVLYSDIPWGSRFILWRHDCDYSLNRALSLAKIEFNLDIKVKYVVEMINEYYEKISNRS